jgi:hypothetical protein
MFARKKIDHIEIFEDDDFRNQLEELAATKKQKAAMLKDAHLIEAARAKGLRVAALDDIVRNLFRKAAGSISPLRQVCWINPTQAGEDPLGWLAAGAPAEAFRKLGTTGEL